MLKVQLLHGGDYVLKDKPADLGPRQIEWLKANVPQFGPAKEAADAALQHAAETKRQMPAPAPSAAS